MPLPAGNGVVAEALAAMDQRLVIVRGEEESAELRVFEMREHGVEDLAQPGRVLVAPAKLQHLEQRVGEIGVVVEIGVEMRDAILGGGQQPAASIGPVRHRLRAHELERAFRRRREFRLVEHARGDRQAADGERVPAAEHLVVEAGPHALAADRQQFRARAVDVLFDLGRVELQFLGDLLDRHEHVRVPRAFEVRLFVESEAAAEHAPFERRQRGAALRCASTRRTCLRGLRSPRRRRNRSLRRPR